MKKKMLSKSLFTLAVSMLFVTSCTNDVDLENINGEIEWNPALALPIGSASTTVEQIYNRLDSTELGISSKGQELMWSMKDSVPYGLKQFRFPAFNHTFSTPPVFDIPIGSEREISIGSNTILSFGFDMSQEGITRVDSAYIKKITFPITVNASHEFPIEKISIRYELTEVYDDYNQLVYDWIEFNAWGTPVYKTTPANNRLKLITTSATRESGLTFKITDIRVKAPTGGTTIPASTEITLHFDTIKDFDYEAAFGEFHIAVRPDHDKEYKINIPDAFNGSLKFLNPTVEVSVYNNSGIQANYDILYVKAYTEGDEDNAIFADFNGNQGTRVEIAKRANLEAETAITHYTIDKDNGATYKFFENDSRPTPNTIKYGFIVSVNNATATPSFLTPNSRFDIVATGKIPFYMGEGSYYAFNDSIQGVGDSINSLLEQLEEQGFNSNVLDLAIIRLDISNGLPIAAIYEMEFLDKLGNPVDTTGTGIGAKYTLTLPKLDNDGIVLEPSANNIDIKLTGNQIENVLKKTETIAYKIGINGEDKDEIKHKLHFVKQNTFGVKAGVFLKAKFETNITKK